MPQPLNAVIAGSKSFVDAVQPQLQLRLGAAPEVATDPAAALQACARRGGLLVFEHGAPEWAAAVRALRVHPGSTPVAVIAAVSDAAVAAGPLEGVDETVRWQGRPDPVMWAVERVVARARGAVQPTPKPAAPPPSLADEVVDLRELCVVEEGQTPAAAVALPPVAEIELMLAAALGGTQPDGSPFQAVTRQLAQALSPLERAALQAEPLQVDAAPIRNAAALRWKVAAILEAAATRGTFDGEAARRATTDLDASLSALNVLAEAAPPEAQRAVHELRAVLVTAGLELGDAALTPAVKENTDRRSPQRAATRVLSVSAGEEQSVAAGNTRALAVVLGVVLAAALAYHGWRAHLGTPRVAWAGAPANTTGVARASSKVLTALPGQRVAESELDRFKATEEARGNVVRQVAPGTWIAVPRAEPAPGAGPSGGTP